MREASNSFTSQILIEYSVYRNGKFMKSSSDQAGHALLCTDGRDSQQRFKVQPLMADGQQYGWMMGGDCGGATSNKVYHLVVPSQKPSQLLVLQKRMVTQPVFLMEGKDQLALIYWSQETVAGGTATSVYVPKKEIFDLVRGDLETAKFGLNRAKWPVLNDKDFSTSLGPKEKNFPAYFFAGFANKDLEMMETALKEDFDPALSEHYETKGAPKSREQARRLLDTIKENENLFKYLDR